MRFKIAIAIAIFMAVLSILPAISHAQCSAPYAEMGVIIFNKDHKVMQYCNGDDWVGLWGSGGAALPKCSNGEIPQYNANQWVCNDGSGIENLNASNLASGTVPVARLGTSGTRNNTTYLRGDNTWAAISASGGKVTAIRNYSSPGGQGTSVTTGLHSICVPRTSHDSTNMSYALVSGPNADGKSTFRCSVGWGPAACAMMCFDF